MRHGRFRASVLLAFFVTLVTIGCGNPSATRLIDETPTFTREPMSREQLLAQLEKLGAPAGTSSNDFAALKTALRIQLESGPEKYTAKAPTGSNSAVYDLVFSTVDGARVISWSYRNAGDYDLNGEVNPADLSPLGSNLNKDSNSLDWQQSGQFADGDRNGVINLADISPIGANLLTQVSAYRIEGADSEDGPWIELGTVNFGDGAEVIGNLRSFTFSVDGLSQSQFRVLPLDAAGNAGIASNLAASYILQENARPVGYGELEFVSWDGTTLVVRALTSEAQVSVGDVIAGEDSGGYLIRAEEVSQDGDLYTITGSRAALDEYILAGGFTNTLSPETETAENKSGSANKTASGTLSYTFEPVNMAGQVIYDANGLKATVTQGTVQFTPTIVTDLQTEWWGGVKYFEASAAGEVVYNFEVALEGDFKGAGTKEVGLPELTSPPFPTGVPGIVAQAYIKFDAGLSVGGTFKGECGAGLGRRYYSKIGAAYHGGKWHDVGVPITSTNTNNKDFYVFGDARGTAKAYVRATVGIRANGAVGAELIGTGDLTANAEFRYPPPEFAWSLDGGLELGYSMYGGIWNTKLVDFRGTIARVGFHIGQGTIAGTGLHNWNQFGGGPRHNGLPGVPAISTAPGTPMKKAWENQVDTGGVDWKTASGPVVDQYGNVYVGDIGGYLHCFSPDGRFRWNAQTDPTNVIISSACVGKNGNIYVGTWGEKNGLWAYNNSGDFLWYMPTYYPVFSSPTYDPVTDTIYFAEHLIGGSQHAFVYAVKDYTRTFEKLWAYEIDSECYGSPAVFEYGDEIKVVLALGEPKNQVVMLTDHRNGDVTQDWFSPNSIATYYNTPVVNSANRIIVADSRGAVQAISPFDGQQEWLTATDGSASWCTPAIGPNDEVYVGTNAGYLYAFDSNGNMRWWLANHTVATGLAVSQEGILFAPLTEGRIKGLKDLGSSAEEVFSGQGFGGAYWGAPCLDFHNGKPRLIAGDAFDGLTCWERK